MLQEIKSIVNTVSTGTHILTSRHKKHEIVKILNQMQKRKTGKHTSLPAV